MIARSLVLAVAGLLVTAQASKAECSLGRPSITGGGIEGRYDGLTAGNSVISTIVRLSGSDDCRLSRVNLSISPDESDPGAFGGQLVLKSGSDTLVGDLRIARRSSASATQGLSDGDASRDVVLGATGNLVSEELILTLPAGQMPPPGLYTARVRLNADASADQVARTSGTPVDVRIRVTPFVGLAAASSTTLDLGILQPGGQSDRGVSFRAYANTPYEIEFASDNEWTLQRLRSSSGQIAYEPMLSGSTVGGTPQRSARFERARGSYQTHEFNARVGEFSRAAAGVYSDWVTIRIRPAVGG